MTDLLASIVKASRILQGIVKNSSSNITSNPDDIDANVNIEDSTEPISESDQHNHYLFLLIIDLVAFIALTILCYYSKKRVEESSEVTEDGNSLKIQFIRTLISANVLRAISLVIIISIENNSGNNPTGWINFIVHAVPTMLFCSAYMVIVIILANAYYKMRDQTNFVVEASLKTIIVIGYVLLAIVALVTFTTKSFKTFAYISVFVIGIIDICIGSMTIYYGQLMTRISEEKNRYEKSDDTMKVGFAFYFRFILFLRGLVCCL